MKKIFIVLCTSVALYACGGGDKNEKKETATAPAKEATASTNPYEDQALPIIGKSDCATCHKVNEASTGPAWKDVAKKYEHTDANVKMLAGKIIKGGSGNWGTIPMTGHPNLTEEEATTLANYVLSLK
jgi:cytochrome c